LAAQQKDPEILLRHKYEAMESLLRILRYLGKTSPIVEAHTPEELGGLETLLDGEYKYLSSFKPWREKRAMWSWRPWSRRAPSCRSLAKAVL
jgi:hypothetical protein